MYDFIVHRLLRIPYRLYSERHAAPQKARAVLVFVHGIASSTKMWQKTIDELRNSPQFDKVDIVAVDLLGHGKSPKPSWVTYNTKLQARALHRTLRSLSIGKRVGIVGHSLGALTAVEYASHYQDGADVYVLCSPPFYRSDSRKIPTADDVLQRIYREFAKHPKHTERLLKNGQWYSQLNKGYTIDESNAQIFVRTLKSSIINQTAYDDALKIRTPTMILSGVLDPIVIDSNIKSLAKKNPHIQRWRIPLSGHEITPRYRRELIKTLDSVIEIIVKDTL